MRPCLLVAMATLFAATLSPDRALPSANPAVAQPGVLGFDPTTYFVPENSGHATITVTRTAGADGAVSASYAATAGSAVAGVNFMTVSGTLTWADQESAPKSIAVPLIDDGHVDPTLTVNLSLSVATGGAVIDPNRASGVLDIQDTDSTSSSGSVQFASSFFAGAPGGPATILVTRGGGSGGPAGVHYSTGGGSAAAGVDYTPVTGTLAFAAGDDGPLSFQVPLLASGAAGGSKNLGLALSDPTTGATLGSPPVATLVIQEPPAPAGPLTIDDEICDEFRASGLLDRIRVGAPQSNKPVGVNVAFTRSGDFAGIAYSGNGPGTAEHQLAFSTNPEETTLLRNPQRLQLFSISVTRNALNSDLVPHGDPDELAAAINPTNDPNVTGAALLTFDNVDPNGRDSDAKPGRGLTPLLSVCHGKLTGADVHLLRVLSKVARASAATGSAKLAIFRGAGSNVYRIDLYPLDSTGAATGRLAVTVSVSYDPAGNLASGAMHVLPRCGATLSAACTTSGPAELDLVKPQPAGAFAPPTPYRVFTLGKQGDGQPDATIDWKDLLNGSTWQAPP
ncbi:MAG TPA: Calx-beta domain-containing protein [Thermoanaerobaculia bacterium]|nr:Calx-beta domain-containing protein [Thermoanaerobaculia bacterium]